MGEVVEVLRALADPVRWRLMELLHERGETCVCELVDALEATQSNISAHLRVLRQVGLVRSEKHGKWVFYALHTERAAEVISAVRGVLDPATAAADRPADALYQTCCSTTAPFSRAEAEAMVAGKGACGGC